MRFGVIITQTDAGTVFSALALRFCAAHHLIARCPGGTADGDR